MTELKEEHFEIIDANKDRENDKKVNTNHYHTTCLLKRV
jgi:hypothetical protein